MALITPDGGQSSVSLNGQSTTFLVNKILTEMPAAPDTLVNSVLQDILREFYTVSGAWREVLGPYRLLQGRPVIYLNPVDQYTQVQNVLGAWLYPSTVGGNSRQYLTPNSRMVQGNSTAPAPSTYWMSAPDVMNLYPIPDGSFTGAVVWVYASCLPLTNTTRLPQISTTHHMTGLISGTLWRLYMMKSKPWGDPTLAKMHYNIYIQERRRARHQAQQGWSIGEAPWRFPHFAGRGIHGSAPMAANN